MKKFLVILSILLVLAFGAGSVLAQESQPPQNTTATITVEAGSLSIAPKAVTCDTVTLNGAPQTTDCASAEPWRSVDPTGSGAGYHMMVRSTKLMSGEHEIPLQGFRMQLLDSSFQAVETNSPAPDSLFDSEDPFGVTLTESDQNFAVAAVDTGMGTFDFSPTFELDVPAETYAGTYTATLTVSIVTGP